ncbi:MAG: HD domain-containing phosphohydrolase [Gemmatimonadota bacterium]
MNERAQGDRRGFLGVSLPLSFWILAIPVGATFLFPEEWLEIAGPLWLLALAPMYLLAQREGWRGVAVALGGTVGLLLLVQLAVSPLARRPPESLAWVVPLLILGGMGISMLPRPRDRGHGTGDPELRHASEVPEELRDALAEGAPAAPVSVVLFELRPTIPGRRGGVSGAALAVETMDEILGTACHARYRPRDGAGRVFLSVLRGTDEEGASAFAERVFDAFAVAIPQGADAELCAAVAVHQAAMRSSDELLAAASLALGRAREAGHGALRVFGRPASTGGGRAVTGEDAYEASGPSPTAEPASPQDPHRPRLSGQGREILLVDDDTSVRTVISSHLQELGFNVTERSDPDLAVRSLDRKFAAAIAALRPRDAPARAFVSAAKARWPSTPVVVITGIRDARLAADALAAGADRYLFRPFGFEELDDHLRELLEQARENHSAASDGTGSLAQATTAPGGQALLAGLRTLAEAAEMRDPHTRGGQLRMAAYSAAILEGIEPTERREGIESDALKLACELCDVGKLAVPISILTKVERLTESEYALVRTHPRESHRILSPLLQDELVDAVALWHHERWDGKGYPDGLAGPSIPLAGRIVAIADSLEAMTSPRAYRGALSWEESVDQIRARVGTQFDPSLYPAFERALPRLKAIHDRQRSAVPDGTDPEPEEASPLPSRPRSSPIA